MGSIPVGGAKLQRPSTAQRVASMRSVLKNMSGSALGTSAMQPGDRQAEIICACPGLGTKFRWLVLMMFPVLRINCIGRNDAAHAREMVGG